MDFLIKWLASLYETFKLKNPLVATVILVILGTAVNTVHNGELWGLFTLPDWGVTVVEYVGTFLMIVTGTQTFKYLPPEKQAKVR